MGGATAGAITGITGMNSIYYNPQQQAHEEYLKMQRMMQQGLGQGYGQQQTQGQGYYGPLTGLPGETVIKSGGKPKEKSMVKELGNDVKSFVKEHKSLIYWVLVLYLFDYFFFDGTFKAKLKEICNKIIGKVETQLHDTVEKTYVNKA